MSGRAEKAPPHASASVSASASAQAPADLDAETFDRYGAAVFGQALLMLGDENLAGQVACSVLVSECKRPPAGRGDLDQVPGRLAVAVLRCCEQLGDGAPEPDGLDRAVLGLVVYGRLGYREAARELAISPTQAAARLRAALLARPGSRPA